MDGKERSFSKQAAPNLFANLLFVAANALVGLFLVPYYIGSLGIAAYGIVPLATSITSYIVLVSDALSEAVSRYMCVYVQGGKQEESRRMYNSALFGTLKVVLALLPVIILVAIASPYIFNIGPNSAIEVQILFMLILGAVLLNSWSNNFLTVLFSNNRLDYQNYIKASQVIIQIVVIVLLFTFWEKNLVSIGIAYIFAATMNALLGYFVSRRVSPQFVPRYEEYDKEEFRKVCSLGSWTIVNALGNLLFIQASIIVCNVLLGPEIEGAFTIVTTMVVMISVLGGTVVAVLTPITYYHYSRNQKTEMIAICKTMMKIVGISMGILAAFLCVFSKQLLTVWVGSEFIFLEEIIWIMMLSMALSIAISPAFPISVAYLKVKIPGTATLLFGILNILLAIIFVEVFGMGLVGIGAAWAIAMFLKNGIFNPIYHALILNESKTLLFGPLLYGSLWYFVSVLVFIVVDGALHPPAMLPALLLLFAVTFSVLGLIGFRVVMNKSERSMFLGMLPERIRHIAKHFF